VPNAAHADSADSATKANSATSAANAAHATNADHATSADTATKATNADHATSADHATNSDAVSGRHVSSVFYAQNAANGPTTVLALDGLTLKASCSTTNGVTLSADTVKDNSTLTISKTAQAVAVQVGSFSNFDTADNDLTIMSKTGAGGGGPVSNADGQVQIDFATPVTGSLFLRNGGAVVSVSLQVFGPSGSAFGGADACLLTGTAMSNPPVGNSIVIIPSKRR
jgi:hypothetical protein